MALILASGSPRRRELLTMLGAVFTVRTAEIDETMDPSRPPEQEVGRVSAAKAAAVAAGPEDVVIAADTIVVADGRVLGKPADAADALAMLKTLSGRTHHVLTGLTVRRGAQVCTEVVSTAVTFRPCTEAELAAYVATGEPLDKAGAYGIQGRASVLIEGISGDYYNVVGLPLCTLGRLLREFDVAWMEGT